MLTYVVIALVLSIHVDDTSELSRPGQIEFDEGLKLAPPEGMVFQNGGQGPVRIYLGKSEAGTVMVLPAFDTKNPGDTLLAAGAAPIHTDRGYRGWLMAKDGLGRLWGAPTESGLRTVVIIVYERT